MSYTLLPADSYTVINKSILTNNDKNNLIAFYEPIIGPLAIALYLTLWNDLDKFEIESREFTHHHLMSIMKTDLNTLREAREILESVGLIKTYYKEGEIASYIYELYSTLPVKEFLSHPKKSYQIYYGRPSHQLVQRLYDRWRCPALQRCQY